MRALVDILVCTYNDPTLNNNIKLIRFRTPKLRVFNSEIGRTNITTSSMMLRTAPV
jgi:hypothetical protein